MNPSTIYCSLCGAGNKGQATYCFSCGKALQIGTVADSNSTGRFSPQQMLKQRYRIVTLLGRGGMGAVYKAEDTQFGGRLIAIKEMSQHNLSPQDAARVAEQFKREAHILANLKHPNLPSIYDYFGEHGRWYLVMDFIEGTTLTAHLDKVPGHVLPMTQTLEIGIQLSKVLGYLHTRPTPIIFRDLKPLNIMITPENDIYLIDFGIARLFKPGQAMDTVAYVSTGYAAPEQFGQAQTSPQSDIYSLGATLHQLLSGNKPSSNVPLFTFKALNTYNPNIPPSLAELVSKMVHIDPAQRPASMAIIRQELERIQQLLKQLALSLPPTQYAPPPPPPYTPHTPPDTQESQQLMSSPQPVVRPTLPKNRVWKALLIGIVTGVSLFFFTDALNGTAVSLAIAIASLLVISFITGKVVISRRMGLFMGCIAGTAFIIAGTMRYPYSHLGSVFLISTLISVLFSGLLGLLGAWLATIGHPYYKYKKP